MTTSRARSRRTRRACTPSEPSPSACTTSRSTRSARWRSTCASSCPVGALAALLSRSRIFTTLTAATPGMRELLTIGKVWELAQHERRTRGAAALRPGRARRAGDRTRSGDAAGAAHVRVGRARGPGRQAGPRDRELPRRPATHRGAGRVDRRRDAGRPRRSSCARGCGSSWAWTSRWSSSTPSFRTASPSATSERCGRRRPRRRGTPPCSRPRWARHQRAQIARLRQGLQGVALVTLPFVFQSALDRAALERLSRELEP